MTYSDTNYTGWKDGKCLRVTAKFAGHGAESVNAKSVADIVRQGYEIREMPRDEAVSAHVAAVFRR